MGGCTWQLIVYAGLPKRSKQMTGLFGNIITVLFLVAALGILGLVVYGCVAKAYGETVLAKTDARAPKYRRYGHFLWRLVYPVFAVTGICSKILVVNIDPDTENEGETYMRNGAVWHRDSDGLWRDYTGNIDYSASQTGKPY
jgi:hypothetical protein